MRIREIGPSGISIPVCGEFTIEFFFGGVENEILPKSARSARFFLLFCLN